MSKRGYEPEVQMDGQGSEGRAGKRRTGSWCSMGRVSPGERDGSIHRYLSDQRTQLPQRKVLMPKEKHLVFTQDYRFSSPSIAAGVLVGGYANERKEWKDSVNGRSLR